MSDKTDSSGGATAVINPVRFGMENRFVFECHKGVSCFTTCCRGINILLTPYDIVRLKNRLGLSSSEFLAIYTEPHLLEKTDLPVVSLKLLDDEQSSCPFVRDDGCIVYEDRPTACRYYPLGVATLSHKEDEGGVPDGEGFFFFVNEPHCRGFEEKKEWTVAEWRKDQGVDIHDEINAEWTDLVVRKRSFPPNIQLTEQAKKMFFMASYDVDAFRRFVFESSFLSRYDIDPGTMERIRSSEIELLKFGFRWLKSILFKGEGFTVKK
ncbi:MAG: YkgJ family cysteine cluster protein [Thermodesulfobacteriota bacterium]